MQLFGGKGERRGREADQMIDTLVHGSEVLEVGSLQSKAETYYR